MHKRLEALRAHTEQAIGARLSFGRRSMRALRWDQETALIGFTRGASEGLAALWGQLEALDRESGDREAIRRMDEGFGALIVRSECWGFDDFDRLCRGLQQIVWDLESGRRHWNSGLGSLLRAGLDALEEMVQECEAQVRRRCWIERLLGALAESGKAV